MARWIIQTGELASKETCFAFPLKIIIQARCLRSPATIAPVTSGRPHIFGEQTTGIMPRPPHARINSTRNSRRVAKAALSSGTTSRESKQHFQFPFVCFSFHVTFAPFSFCTAIFFLSPFPLSPSRFALVRIVVHRCHFSSVTRAHRIA